MLILAIAEVKVRKWTIRMWKLWAKLGLKMRIHFHISSKDIFCIRLRLRILILEMADSDTDLGLIPLHMHCCHIYLWIRKFLFVLSLCISADPGGQSCFSSFGLSGFIHSCSEFRRYRKFLIVESHVLVRIFMLASRGIGSGWTTCQMETNTMSINKRQMQGNTTSLDNLDNP